MLPQRIGRYEVNGLAGSGGFATVYEGADPRLDARVAIKVLADNWSRDPEIRRRFRQEAVLLRRLQSEHAVPGLVEVFDVDQTESGQPFFIMGWAGGGTLWARAQGRAWKPEQLAPIVNSLTQSLGHLHARGVVHRDIKPQNLLIRTDEHLHSPSELLAPGERLLVGDFGLAKDLTHEASTLSLVAGTERYMAPEQLVFGSRVDHRADVYAVTAMIADLVTNRGAEPMPTSLQPFVTKGTAESPDDRFATMSELHDEFFVAIARAAEAPIAAEPAVDMGEPKTVTVAPNQAVPASPAGRPWTRRWMFAAGVLVAVIAAYFALTSSDSAIAGPPTIVSGESAVYSVEGASEVRWTDPAGRTVDGPTLEVTGRLPGQLTLSAVVGDEELQRSVTVAESASGPTILGPRVVRTGEQGIFEAIIPEGDTFYWLHPTRGRLTTQQLSVVQEGDAFIVGLISIDAAGVERGAQQLVTSG